MKVIQRRILQGCLASHADAKGRLLAWLAEADAATWTSPNDLKARYPSASLLRDNRCVFNIGGNRYRLVVKINYEIDAETI
jgi:mRNA interferase HigB